jgi:hypothetical protein
MNSCHALFLVGFAALSGCSQSEGERAEKQYEIVLKTYPTKRERCNEQRKVADAYLRDQNQQKYQMWDMEADTTCLDADLRDLR